MNGDITRSTFDKKKHYRKVNMQQGRVQTDADWNEQNDIQSHHEQTFLHHLIGKSGTLDQDAGFKIDKFFFEWDESHPTDDQKIDLQKFLRNNFGLLWIPEDKPSISKSTDGKTLTISTPDGSHTMNLVSGSNNNAVLSIDGKVVYTFLQSVGGTVQTKEYLIRRGNYYVDGILCENEHDILTSRQPDIMFSEQKHQFLICSWEDLADSAQANNALAGFVSSMFPEMAGPNLKVIKTSMTDITISDESSLTATITLDGRKATLKSPDSTKCISLETKVEDASDRNKQSTLIYYSVENPSLPSEPNIYYLAYLDTWDQHVTYIEDSYIREKALGGADTGTRTKTAWRVKLLPIPPPSGTADSTNWQEPDKCKAWQMVDSIVKNQNSNTGKMQVVAESTTPKTNICQLYETAGYRGLENHFYRVEVHTGGDSLEHSSFKWSRDNGIVVSPITKLRPFENSIEIQSRGRDANLDFKKDGWIEITDDIHEVLGLPGTLVRVKEIKEKVIEYDPTTVIGYPIMPDNFASNPKARKWDSNGVLKSKDATKYLDLENGIQFRLSNGNYRTGQYWVFPVRANSEEGIEWPRVGDKSTDEPLALPPIGVTHHYAPLAILGYKDDTFSILSDCRSFFPSLSDQLLIHYAGGDGQEAEPKTRTLSKPLRVLVTLGNVPINKTSMKRAKVRFTIVEPTVLGKATIGNNNNKERYYVSETDDDGIASCQWILDESEYDQLVWAELEECGKPKVPTKVPTIYFHASLQKQPTSANIGLSANTGWLTLQIPDNLEGWDSPLKYRGFQHFLDEAYHDLPAPPAIILGRSTEPRADTIIKTEDDDLTVDNAPNTTDKISDIYFKPAVITKSTFDVHLWLPPGGDIDIPGNLLYLRWWAIPGNEKGDQGTMAKPKGPES